MKKSSSFGNVICREEDEFNGSQEEVINTVKQQKSENTVKKHQATWTLSTVSWHRKQRNCADIRLTNEGLWPLIRTFFDEFRNIMATNRDQELWLDSSEASKGFCPILHQNLIFSKIINLPCRVKLLKPSGKTGGWTSGWIDGQAEGRMEWLCPQPHCYNSFIVLLIMIS